MNERFIIKREVRICAINDDGSYGERPFARIVKYAHRKRGWDLYRLDFNGKEQSRQGVRTLQDGIGIIKRVAEAAHMRVTRIEVWR